ncbi:hypothetical protein [Bosea sp. ANAM02]|uniref:hypothetical protein n=1 Tax=Bosea sp. ANAM02 TaxID=2020412 RepID=UPI00140ED16B|nr:hypothetical protein [Bosea sp. ANAM02]BCB22249.1 hypothetical protein OCUBac02_51430 [Bosea sp. ANAM02]
MPIPSLPAYYQPQVWIDDHALPDGPKVQFDAAIALFELPNEPFTAAVQSILAGNVRNLDPVGEAAVEESFNGPFYVRIERDDFETWCGKLQLNPEEVGNLEQGYRKELLKKLQAAHFTEIADWRLKNDDGSELSADQQKPWPVTISAALDGGILIGATAPDGTVRELLIEIDQGRFKVGAYLDQTVAEEPTVMHVLDDGVIVSHGRELTKFVPGEEGGVSVSELPELYGSPAPGFRP